MRSALIWILTAFLATVAHGQTLTQRPVAQNPVTPAEMTGRLEKSAVRTAKSAPNGAARGASVDFSWPADAEEYRKLAKHVLVLVSVVTQDAAELPLRRVYVDSNGKQTQLTRLSSQRSGVAKDTKTFSVLGPYREDGFYLAPAGVMMADGHLQADFAVRRIGFNLYRLPGTPPDFIKADSDPMPAKDARPETPALKAMLQREYKGFELPESLR
ncbi:MAG: hypothetical protein ABIL01_29115 [Pseudomonadota bacterium]